MTMREAVGVISRAQLTLGLAGLQLADLIVSQVSPAFGDEHLDHLGVPEWLRPLLPLVKGAAVVALLGTAKRPTTRSAVGAGLVGYYAAAVTFHALSNDGVAEAAPAAAFGALAAAIV
jgi:hypothetical protein